MQRHWKRYLLLLALVAVLSYGTWRAYTDYQLRSYPQQIADSIPLPSGIGQIKEETVFAKKCRSTHIYRYYSTDLDWDSIVHFYSDYAQSSFWMPKGDEMDYLHRFNSQEVIYFFVDRIGEHSSDSELASLAKEKTVFVVQVSYLQDDRLQETVCRSED
jgi:hypothetical protein